MRQLLPFPRDPVDPAAVYAELPAAGTRPAVRWRLQSLCEQDGFLFLRYRPR